MYLLKYEHADEEVTKKSQEKTGACSQEPVGAGERLVCPKGFLPLQHVTICKKRMLKRKEAKDQRGKKNPYRHSALIWYKDTKVISRS